MVRNGLQQLKNVVTTLIQTLYQQYFTYLERVLIKNYMII